MENTPDEFIEWALHPDGFTCWMMGAGVRGGTSYGATDPFGRRAEVDPTTVWEFYATVLHLLGLNYNRRLTNVHGKVIRQVLA